MRNRSGKGSLGRSPGKLLDEDISYLLGNGWIPSILSAHPRAYQRTGDDQLDEIPDQVRVSRAFALDAKRHLAIKGRHPLLFSLPDRWSSWWLGGVFSGLNIIRREHPRILWSTYPIATAHLIGLTLSWLSGLPWVADFRDSMTEDHYPRNPTVRKTYLWIERHVIARAARIVFTTPGTMNMYAKRYPDISSDKWVVIPNGYDEGNFREVETESQERIDKRNIELVHSGVLYPSERDPSYFFAALSELQAENKISSSYLRIKLRATANDELFATMIEDYGISAIVSLEPSIPYAEALREMLQSDGLLLFQASNCNHQIPAKLYEYMRAQRPLLALTDPAGDTAKVMLNAGITTIARLDNTVEIKNTFLEFLELIGSSRAPLGDERVVSQYSRQAATVKLAKIFDDIDG